MLGYRCLSSVIFGSTRLISWGHRFRECSVTFPKLPVALGQGYLITVCRQFILLPFKVGYMITDSSIFITFTADITISVVITCGVDYLHW